MTRVGLWVVFFLQTVVIGEVTQKGYLYGSLESKACECEDRGHAIHVIDN